MLHVFYYFAVFPQLWRKEFKNSWKADLAHFQKALNPWKNQTFKIPPFFVCIKHVWLYLLTRNCVAFPVDCWINYSAHQWSRFSTSVSAFPTRIFPVTSRDRSSFPGKQRFSFATHSRRSSIACRFSFLFHFQITFSYLVGTNLTAVEGWLKASQHCILDDIL